MLSNSKAVEKKAFLLGCVTRKDQVGSFANYYPQFYNFNADHVPPKTVLVWENEAIKSTSETKLRRQKIKKDLLEAQAFAKRLCGKTLNLDKDNGNVRLTRILQQIQGRIQEKLVHLLGKQITRPNTN